MADLVLTRFCDSKRQGVFGRLAVGDQTLYTVERPDLDNQPRISCIPAGLYRVRHRFYNRGQYDAMEVMNVLDRSHILFHKGNTMHNSMGCILPGLDLGFVNGSWAVVSSKPAFELLYSWFLDATDHNKNETVELLIEWEDHDDE